MVLVKIISGSPNSGKTTLAAALEEDYRRQGYKTAGFLSDAEYTDGRKDSYYFRDIVTGRRELAVAASVPSGEPGWFKHGFSRFYFSDRAFRFAENLLKDAAFPRSGPEADYIFIDELGPLELSGGGLFNIVQRLLGCWSGSLYLVIREALIDSMSSKLGLVPGLTEIVMTRDQAQ